MQTNDYVIISYNPVLYFGLHVDKKLNKHQVN